MEVSGGGALVREHKVSVSDVADPFRGCNMGLSCTLLGYGTDETIASQTQVSASTCMEDSG